MTHKKIILKFFKEGYQTPEIARKTDHTEEACDRYIKAYKKVEKLNKTMKSEEIANILGMGKSLVNEYIRIINEEWVSWMKLIMASVETYRSFGSLENLSLLTVSEKTL